MDPAYFLVSFDELISYNVVSEYKLSLFGHNSDLSLIPWCLLERSRLALSQ